MTDASRAPPPLEPAAAVLDRLRATPGLDAGTVALLNLARADPARWVPRAAVQSGVPWAALWALRAEHPARFEALLHKAGWRNAAALSCFEIASVRAKVPLSDDELLVLGRYFPEDARARDEDQRRALAIHAALETSFIVRGAQLPEREALWAGRLARVGGDGVCRYGDVAVVRLLLTKQWLAGPAPDALGPLQRMAAVNFRALERAPAVWGSSEDPDALRPRNLWSARPYEPAPPEPPLAPLLVAEPPKRLMPAPQLRVFATTAFIDREALLLSHKSRPGSRYLAHANKIWERRRRGWAAGDEPLEERVRARPLSVVGLEEVAACTQRWPVVQVLLTGDEPDRQAREGARLAEKLLVLVGPSVEVATAVARRAIGAI